MKTAEIMWICENRRYDAFAYHTLARRRSDCRAAMLENSGLTWEHIKSCGWKPVKVQITIEKIEK